MANAAISEKLEQMYKDEKSKNFVLHLVRSYLPVDKPSKIFEKPKDLKKFKCALTGTQLISVDELFEYMGTDEFSVSFFKGIKEFAGRIGDGGPVAERTDITELKKFLKGRVQGWQGHETTTFLCQDAIEELYNWTSTKILKGDGKLNWTLRSMMTKVMKDATKFKGGPKREPKPNPMKEIVNKPATSMLGDNDVLKSLKEKLENGKLEKR